MILANVTTRILDGFDDPSFTREQWAELQKTGDTDSVNLTWSWLRSWWGTFGRGKLLLILAERDGRSVALAPLFAESGMIFNLCPEDNLDFIGDIGDPLIIDAVLEKARSLIPDFLGFKFYFIPDASRTGARLQEAALRLGLVCHDEGDIPSPMIDIAGQPEIALAATKKKSLLRHERYFTREGDLEVLHLKNGADIFPHLDEYFQQHIARRATTDAPSLFLNPIQCAYYRKLTEEIGPTGWLRFTRINWNGKPIAFHYGLCYQGRYLFGVPSFDVELFRFSPGEVLLRQLLLASISEGAKTFDFGVGDEAYKYRFATHVNRLRTWGLYQTSSKV